MGEEKKEAQPQKMREILIQFDAQRINIVKADVASNWELESILRKLLTKLNV